MNEALTVEEANAFDHVHRDLQSLQPREVALQREVHVSLVAVHDEQHGGSLAVRAAVHVVDDRAAKRHNAWVFRNVSANIGNIQSTRIRV